MPPNQSPQANPVKPALSYDDQIALLESRGLEINDHAFATHCLKHHSYYRLSPYRFPFTESTDRDKFLPDASFDQIWNLYIFDRALKHLVIEGCKRVEISLRARLAYEVAHTLGPLGYLDPANFKKPETHERILSNLKDEMGRNNEPFIQHYIVNLGMPCPPIWAAIEMASFGNTSNLLSNLTLSSIRQAIASTYDFDEKNFCSVIYNIAAIRNTCAHHGRLWNRKFTISMKLPRSRPKSLPVNFNNASSLIYNSLVVLVYLVNIIEPGTTFPSRLKEHLQTLDARLRPQMGMPPNWEPLSIWMP